MGNSLNSTPALNDVNSTFKKIVKYLITEVLLYAMSGVKYGNRGITKNRVISVLTGR